MPPSSTDAIAAWVDSGIREFARGEFFEAHEAFERAWLESGAPRSRSLELQALAQVAAALHKDREDHKAEAAHAIMRRARGKLAVLDASAFAIDLDRLRADVDAWLSDVARPIPNVVRTG